VASTIAGNGPTRLGASIRAVRVRLRLRHCDVAARCNLSPSTVSRIERGHIGSFALDSLLAVCGVLRVRIDFVPRWRGGDLDRLLYASHAAMHERLARILGSLPSWVMAPEVTFAVFGERGVIDILAFHQGRRVVLVIELKTQLVDVHDLPAQVDRYRRLARRIARGRDWNADTVGVWVVMRESMTNRRRVAAHASVLRVALPDDGQAARRWLRDPVRGLAALSFLSDVHGQTVRGRATTPRRVRAPVQAPRERGGNRVVAASTPERRPTAR
jgi:transcriptional regulator with XRE-family HTH domain